MTAGAGVAIVTGAGGGIGHAIVGRLGEDGWRVVAADLVTERLERMTGDGEVAVVRADLAVPGGPEAVVEQALARYGRLDLLVNNLGISPQREGFLDADDADWDRTLNVNLLAAVRGCRAALPHLLRHGGVIVNVTSVLSKQPIPQMPDYAAAKAGLAAVTLALSEEFASRGVRVLSVAPGPTITGQWTDPGGQLERMASQTGLSAEAVRTEHVPRTLGMSLGRMVEAREVADVVAFLASPAAAAMTGCEVVVDGGMRKAW